MTKTAAIAGLFFQKLKLEEATADTGVKVGEIAEDVGRMSPVSVSITDGVGSTRKVGLLVLSLVLALALVLVTMTDDVEVGRL